MKRNVTLSMRVLGGWLIGAILLMGCNANDDHRFVSDNKVVKFNSWLLEASSVSRASGEGDFMTKEEWRAGDYIGVYMKESGKPLSDHVIIGDVDNNKYMSTKDGKNSIFIAVSDDDEIYYPYNTLPVSFVAYYPYKNTVTDDYLYPIDISDQKGYPANVDLLYATFEDKSLESMNVPLTFHHQLTKLVLNLQPNLAEDKNAYFGGIKVRANGFCTKAKFSLVNKLISNREEIETIPVKTTSDGKRVEVILIPQTVGTDTYIEFDLFGDIARWNISANKVFEAGKQYEYTLYLGKPWIEVDEEKISPWGDEISVPVNWDDPKYFPVNLVKISGGDHLIGSPENTVEAAVNEYPQHETSVGTFWISSYEITNKQYVDFLNFLSHQYGKVAEELQPHNTIINYEGGAWHVANSSKDNYPVTNVTWYGAKAFAQWLGGDLPSEAEWETACRAGNYGLFSFSSDNNNDNINDLYPLYVNCRDEILSNGDNAVLPVNDNRLAPNKYKLYNMHGNVSEWCRDAVVRNANGSPAPYEYKFSGEGNLCVIRGGSWKDPLMNCRSASRDCALPEMQTDYIGFRVVFPISNVPNLDFGKIERVLSID